MLGKIKKVFFSGVFGVLYISFVAQLVYVLGFMNANNEYCENKMIAMAALSVEWLVLIAARYLSKRSASGNTQFSGNGFRRR